MKVSDCTICNSDRIKQIEYLSPEGAKFLGYKCRKCGHTGLEAAGHGAVLESLKSAADDEENRAFQKFIYYRDTFNLKGKVLIYGSKKGTLVHYMRLGGFEANGIENDRDLAVQSEHLYFFKQYTSYKSIPEVAVYDFLIIQDDLIYSRDPKESLRQLIPFLKTNGRIIIEIPAWRYLPGTVSSTPFQGFSPRSLQSLLKEFFYIDRSGTSAARFFMSGLKKAQPGYIKSTPGLALLSLRHGLVSALLWAGLKTAAGKKYILPLVSRAESRENPAGRFFRYLAYKMKERTFLSKENGRGPDKLTHITYYKGWGNNSGDIILSKCVRDTFNLSGRKSYYIRSLKDRIDHQLIDRINNSKAVVIGGGGLFLPDTNPNAVSGWQWAVSKDQLEEIRKPLLLYAIGYNYFRGQEPNSLFLENLELILQKSSFTGLRNFGSIKKVNELTEGRYRDRILYQPCPTTILSKIQPAFANKGKQGKKVVVNIAFDRFHIRFGHRIYEILSEITQALKEIENAGYEIINASHITADERFRILLDSHGIKYKDIQLQYMFPEEVYKFYSSVDLVMGMRGHAQMIPFGLGTPILSLGTHDKMKWFLDDIKAEDWYVDLNNTDKNLSGEILKKFSEITGNRREIEDRIREQKENLYRVTRENLELISKIIN